MTLTSPESPGETSVASEASDDRTASVVVAVAVVAGVDPAPTLAAVERQRHKPTEVKVVGVGITGAPGGLVLNEDLEEVIAALDSSVDYVWLLHGDAEPRPDALGALVAEVERFDASLAGSKLLVAGTRDTLEGVGSATDVFGEPYSGLDEGEVDLEQYDVVRDVAFVSSISMLVRRDILKGLRGLDSDLPPVAAGLDLSQRVRIAGGRVVVVPSSEVFHHQRCGRGDGGWREQSGRMRAMLKAYRLITLAWVLPFAFFSGLLDSLGSLLLGRWRHIPRYLLSWGWNLAHLPSTLGARRVLARVREVGDEELFRYQVTGSVRLRAVGSELSDRLLRLFDDDQPIARRASEVWNSSGTWGMIGAVLLVLVGLRAVFLGGLPAVGFSLPFGQDPLAALGRFFGGWNAAGLGSTAPVHPVVAPAAVTELVLPGGGEVARSVLTLAAYLGGIFGYGRLASRLGVGGPGAFLGGAAALFGGPAVLLADQGRWNALMAIAILPWALVAVTGPAPTSRRRWWGVAGMATVLVGLVSLFVPVLGVAPLLFALSVKVVGRFESRPLAAVLASVGVVVGIPFMSFRWDQLLGGVPDPVSVGIVPAAALVAALVGSMFSGTWRVTAIAAFASLGGLVAARSVGPGLQEALLCVAAVGVALTVAGALKPRPEWTVPGWVSLGTGCLLLAVSLVGLAGGRAAMPEDAWGESVEFMSLDEKAPARALLVATRPSELPGESVAGPGLWYRLVETDGITLDQAYLGPSGSGDVELAAAFAEMAAGARLEPGRMLADFGIRWVVAVGEADASLRPVLDAQVDLNPLPLAEGLLVYENTAAKPVAGVVEGEAWDTRGTEYFGTPTDQRVRLAIQDASGWDPDWQPSGWAGTVSGADGVATYSGSPVVRSALGVWAALMVAASTLAVWARRRPT